MTKQPPLFVQGDALAYHPPGLEVGVQFIMRCAEPCGCFTVPESAHRVGAWRNAPMISLQPVIEMAIPAVDHLLTEHPVDGPRVGIMPVRWLQAHQHAAHRKVCHLRAVVLG